MSIKRPGRVSAAQKAVKPFVVAEKSKNYPPPAHFNEAQKLIWTNLFAGSNPIIEASKDLAILEQYIRCKEQCDLIQAELDRTWQTDLSNEKNFKKLDKLLSAFNKTSGVLTTLAVKLRLTNQSAVSCYQASKIIDAETTRQLTISPMVRPTEIQ